MSRTALITGATGNVSTALVHALRESPLKLRALVRDISHASHLRESDVRLFTGNLDDPDSLPRAAFDGVDDLWLLTPPSPRAPEHSMNALWAAKQAGVKRVVRMSAIGAAHDAPTRNGRLHALPTTNCRARVCCGLSFDLTSSCRTCLGLHPASPTTASSIWISEQHAWAWWMCVT
jgi:nucleoside-diphosphate-sugar epimerase